MWGRAVTGWSGALLTLFRAESLAQPHMLKEKLGAHQIEYVMWRRLDAKARHERRRKEMAD